MPRLVAFGCSHTYGEGLEDCWNWETRKAGPVASKFAWPQILANLLKRECVNLGRRGASNKEILHNIQMFDFEKDDIVCILWSYITRDCILYSDDVANDDSVKQLVGTVNRKWFSKSYAEYDCIHQQWTCMNYANMLLERKGLEHYHFSVHYANIENPPKWNEVNIEPLDFQHYQNHFPKAFDNMHPGKKAQSKIAKDIKEIIDAHNK